MCARDKVSNTWELEIETPKSSEWWEKTRARCCLRYVAADELQAKIKARVSAMFATFRV